MSNHVKVIIDNDKFSIVTGDSDSDSDNDQQKETYYKDVKSIFETLFLCKERKIWSSNKIGDCSYI